MATSTQSETHHDEYTIRRSGRPYTKDYRVYFERKQDGIPVSPFHDIPLYHDEDEGVLNMIVEVPRWTMAKFEVSQLVRCGRDELRTDNDPGITERKPEPNPAGFSE